MIMRPKEQLKPISEEIVRLGGTPIEFPTIRIEPTEENGWVGRIAETLNEYDWVVFTSANGVRQFFERIAETERDSRDFSPRIAVIGSATAHAVKQYGFKVSFIPSSYLTERLAIELPEVNGKRILLVRAEGTDAKMASMLKERDAIVNEIYPYRVARIKPSNLPDKYDAILFTSPSTVSSFSEILRSNGAESQGGIVCCIGPVTAKAAEEQGFRVDVVANEHSVKGLLDTLIAKVELK